MTQTKPPSCFFLGFSFACFFVVCLLFRAFFNLPPCLQTLTVKRRGNDKDCKPKAKPDMWGENLQNKPRTRWTKKKKKTQPWQIYGHKGSRARTTFVHTTWRIIVLIQGEKKHRKYRIQMYQLWVFLFQKISDFFSAVKILCPHKILAGNYSIYVIAR